MAIALKVQDTDSYGVDVQDMTSTDENYLAYQMGLEFVADSANALGSLTIDSNHTSVGTFTNTFFNEPVGTHPSTSITSGSTTSILTQNLNSTLSLTDSDVLLPIRWIDSSGAGPAGFKQFLIQILMF